MFKTTIVRLSLTTLVAMLFPFAIAKTEPSDPATAEIQPRIDLLGN